MHDIMIMKALPYPWKPIPSSVHPVKSEVKVFHYIEKLKLLERMAVVQPIYIMSKILPVKWWVFA